MRTQISATPAIWLKRCFGVLLLSVFAAGYIRAGEESVQDEESAVEASEPGSDLPHRYREWLDQVQHLIFPEESRYFLSLSENFRREAFMEKFWLVRDPEPRTVYNELERRWSTWISRTLSTYGSFEDPRAQVLLLNGPPGRFELPNGRVVSKCLRAKEHVEVWFYGGSERTPQRFVVVFFQPRLPIDEPYRVLRPADRLEPRRRKKYASTRILDLCDSDLYSSALGFIRSDPMSYNRLLDTILSRPRPDSEEWVATFAAMTTDLPPDADVFPVDLEFAFPGRNQHRTAVQGAVTFPAAEAGALESQQGALYGFLLTGEVIRENRLFESFRYRFDVPGDEDLFTIPLVFQRYLRPGGAEIRLKIEDLHGGRFAHSRRLLDIPAAERLASVRQETDLPFLHLLGEANAAAERGQHTIRLVPPALDEIQLGMVRFTAIGSSEFDRVTFFLNDRPILTKTRPPFSVELSLGRSAAAHRLRVVALDEAKVELASDEILVNQGGQRFRVRLAEPRPEHRYERSVSAVVLVDLPDGEALDRVEIFLDEQRVATLYQPPFVQPLLLAGEKLAYVRAVGYLRDGNTSEDLVFINTPEYFEQVDVQYVELYAGVFSKGGRSILDLAREEFSVIEDGAEQEIRRFEYVRDLPIHAALLIDSSASMRGSLERASEAALEFVERTIEEKDRVALLSFAQRPKIEARFTNQVLEISTALAGLRPIGSTALYDSLIFALNYFDGIKGQKALLLLSDGKDESSRFDFESLLQTAFRAGVTIYAIGLDEAARDKEASKILTQVAEETGGRAFFIEDLAELGPIYESIQDELRSQYLIAYQSSSTKDAAEFRAIRVEVERKGVEVRTLSGYYP